MTLSPSLPLSPSLSPPSSARPALARPVFMPSVVAAAVHFLRGRLVSPLSSSSSSPHALSMYDVLQMGCQLQHCLKMAPRLCNVIFCIEIDNYAENE